MTYFAVSIFLSAFLLFQVQPMIGKYILPWFGGTPAVWSTLLLFFQVILLGGYAYAYWLMSRSRRQQSIIHLVALGISLTILVFAAFSWRSPITPDIGWRPPPSSMPIGDIFRILLISVGLPYFLLSTNATLMQSWFHDARPGKSPYWLYALSNSGSLLGLLSYPFLIEPLLPLRAQGLLWSVGYTVFVLLAAYGAWGTLQRSSGILSQNTSRDRGDPAVLRPGSIIYLQWILLPGLASIFLLAVTSHITQEVAPNPFLWILPLSLYLLSFILTFSGKRWYVRTFFMPALALITVLYVWILSQGPGYNYIIQLLFYSILLFIVCMICHGEVILLKPHAKYLPAFYLSLALGGAIGGIFVNLIAPYIFSGFWELPLGVIALWALLALFYIVRGPASGSKPLQVTKHIHFIRSIGFICAVILIAIILTQYIKVASSGALFSERNFYGIVRIKTENTGSPDLEKVTMDHGATQHGFQFTVAEKRHIPTGYFSEESGIGLAIRNFPNRGKGLKIGVLGEGVGTLAVYGQQNDVVRFYEINPIVIDLANGKGSYFSYIKDSSAQIEIVYGDARISLEQELQRNEPQNFDLLVMDAFSSGSIPAHLLTREAFETYIRHLKHEGVLAVNITNRTLNFLPVLIKQAEFIGFSMRTIDALAGGVGSRWVLLSRNLEFLTQPAIAERTLSDPGDYQNFRLWTDDYNNLFQILK